MTESESGSVDAPVRLCCFQRHYGIVCPDGKVMCCLCFDRFDPADLALDADGNKEDVCVPCAEAETAEIARRTQSGRSEDLRGRDDTPQFRERLEQARAERDG